MDIGGITSNYAFFERLNQGFLILHFASYLVDEQGHPLHGFKLRFIKQVF